MIYYGELEKEVVVACFNISQCAFLGDLLSTNQAYNHQTNLLSSLLSLPLLWAGS